MVKYLTKHGNSLALIIDQPVLAILKIKPDSPLELSTKDNQIIVEVASDRSVEKWVAKSRNKKGAKK
jgi:antitoxin component of MazEF toxin-antitoxin module